jgi:hypothetical protein
MSVPLTPSADKNYITARCACLEESMARSLTVISLLFQSTTHCHYRVYTKFFLTYTAISRRNRKVPPLGITALQPQSHFHLGTPYIFLMIFLSKIINLFIIFSLSTHVLLNVLPIIIPSFAYSLTVFHMQRWHKK